MSVHVDVCTCVVLYVSLDILQRPHVYLPQMGSFCLYKDLPGILSVANSIWIVNTCSSITRVETAQHPKCKIHHLYFFLSCKIDDNFIIQ